MLNVRRSIAAARQASRDLRSLGYTSGAAAKALHLDQSTIQKWWREDREAAREIEDAGRELAAIAGVDRG
jgi:predicted transcriptional regulator